MFAKAFGASFEQRERMDTTNLNENKFRVPTVERLETLFGAKALIKINHCMDIALISPVYVPVYNMETQNFRRGDLVFPLRESGSGCEMYGVFVPSGVDDEEESIKISNWFGHFDENGLPEMRKEVYC